MIKIYKQNAEPKSQHAGEEVVTFSEAALEKFLCNALAHAPSYFAQGFHFAICFVLDQDVRQNLPVCLTIEQKNHPFQRGQCAVDELFYELFLLCVQVLS